MILATLPVLYSLIVFGSGPVLAGSSGYLAEDRTLLGSKIAAGYLYTLAVKSDGTLWSWGHNDVGQLGLGDKTDRQSPTQVGTDNMWVAVTAGGFHSLALKSDGTLWSWGRNNLGQLGLGDNTDRLSPTQVGTDNSWVAATAGTSHSLALKSDGTLWSWGYNGYGQLGLGDSINRQSPTQVGTDNSWVAATAGASNSFALKSDGTLWSWGYNGYGALGLGYGGGPVSSPTQVGTDNRWVAVTAGEQTLALKSDGTLWSWGFNGYGQLGLGDTTNRESPTQVGTDNSWVAVAAEGYHTLALKSDGTLWSWGQNDEGQLGLGYSGGPILIPTQVGTDNSWVAVANHHKHSLAVKSDGTLWSWGHNDEGQLGLGDKTDRHSPVQVQAFSIFTPSALTPRGPILIVGNDNFIPANGVNGGGSGTDLDPYIIENWVIDSSTANGIEIRNTTAYFVVRNCVVENGAPTYRGIYLDNVVNGRIENNTCENNPRGIYLDNSSYDNLTNNTCVNNAYGIYLNYSENVNLTNNTCENKGYGIYLNYSDYDNMTGNTCSNNTQSGIYLNYSDYDNMTGNTCSNNTQSGICLYSGSDYDSLTGNTCENNTYDIRLFYAYYNNVTGNTCDNGTFGIYQRNSPYCNLTANTVENTSYAGIFVEFFCAYSNLTGNTCSNNMVGIYLLAPDNNITLTNNTCENNEVGIYISNATPSNNLICHNNLVNNVSQAYDDGTTFWDNGYPSGGNYWSDYTGVDIYSGPNQDIPGGDGIGDNRYNIPGGANQDRYPLLPSVCGVEVTIENTLLEGYPSQVLAYTIDVHNSGNVVDNINLSYIPDGWPDITIVPQVLTDVMPSEHRQATMFVHVPDNAMGCTYKEITVLAESQFCGATDNDTATAHVQELCGVEVTIEWIRQFGTSAVDRAYGMAVGGSDNIYVAGLTYGTLPGQTSSGANDAFVRKYDGSGNELWTRQFGSSADDYAMGVAVDSSDNVYITGITWGALPGQTSSGGTDAFVRKYDSAGNEIWTRQFGTSASDRATGVVVDGSNNIYVMGYTNDALPGQTYSGDTDAFVRKYDSAGNEIWTRQFGTSAFDDVRDVAVDSSDNVYVSGLTLGALPGQENLGNYDAFVRKYDGAGNEIWTRQFGTSDEDYGYGVAVDGSDNVYVAGDTKGALPGQTSSGGRDAFIRKYDGDGNELWTRQFGTSANDRAVDVAVDGSNNAYFSGITSGTFPGQTSSGGYDAFVREYDSAGNEIWTRQCGSSADDYTSGVAVDSSGKVYASGYTYGTLPGQTSSGNVDAFLVKFAVFRGGIEVTIENKFLEGLPCETLAYTISVHNSGNVVDNIILSYIPDGWPDITIVPQVLTDVAPCEIRQATMFVHVPDNALPSTYKEITVVAESQFCGATDNDNTLAHVVETPPPSGTATFRLENMYKVNLYKDNLWLYQGSKLVVKFYKYDGVTLQTESVIHENWIIPWHVVPENENVSQPLAAEGYPSGTVQIARLVLTTDDTGNIISTIASFTVHQSDIRVRYGNILRVWGDQPGQQSAFRTEIGDIMRQWSSAPV